MAPAWGQLVNATLLAHSRMQGVVQLSHGGARSCYISTIASEEIMSDNALTRSQRNERSEDIGRNPTHNQTLGDVIAARFSRRDLVKGTLGTAAIAATVSPLA